MVALSPIGCGAAGHASCKSRWLRGRHGGFGRNSSTSSKNWSATVSQNSLRNTPWIIVPRSCLMICRMVQDSMFKSVLVKRHHVESVLTVLLPFSTKATSTMMRGTCVLMHLGWPQNPGFAVASAGMQALRHAFWRRKVVRSVHGALATGQIGRCG